MFTRQHFEAIAEIVRRNAHIVGTSETFDEGACYAGSQIADELCDLFSADNPQFDREEFQRECGF